QKPATPPPPAPKPEVVPEPEPPPPVEAEKLAPALDPEADDEPLVEPEPPIPEAPEPTAPEPAFDTAEPDTRPEPIPSPPRRAAAMPRARLMANVPEALAPAPPIGSMAALAGIAGGAAPVIILGNPEAGELSQYPDSQVFRLNLGDIDFSLQQALLGLLIGLLNANGAQDGGEEPSVPTGGKEVMSQSRLMEMLLTGKK
ncbi:MAG: hypothetical protein HQL39_14260, partial [Alphaproteobacteria bacterium]|nr:hypothetical protein [Alphaproteobacteria bacterium]